jgi:hypothetical protein
MPLPLRVDFDAPRLRALAKRTKDGPQPSGGHSIGYADGTSYGGSSVKRSFLISWRDWIRGSSPSSIMRQLCPHRLVSGRASGGPDHDPACLRGRARERGTPLGSAAYPSPGSNRSPLTPDPVGRCRASACGLGCASAVSGRLGRLQHRATRHQPLGDEPPERHE